ncbi:MULTISPECIES: DHA2 family efflux MFS transporter permease subunit [Sorangium]|uniref:DSBA oxidoreductase n=1 Tax=Sorangium cellulosum TaxID=56 RepID=A0A4P2QW54_SORCE|nr:MULTISPECIES: DHA2 family efflux MFS transporter permease subunit [Sorangium]AUX34707.1 DSBA oxidoreductase [Sorangium cellulosum]WCQ94019.1 Multidrug export protein EmrB [Sorangium sp. Soce836]
MAEAAIAAAPAHAVAPVNANRWLVAAAVALGALLEIVDTSIVNVALTEMQSSLGATLTQVSWVVSSYAIANVIILPLTAWLGHRFGKKRYFVFSLIAFTAASVLCGVASSLPMLIVARVLQGLGGGGLLAKAQSILFETFPKEEQAMAQGFFSSIVIAGPTIGPTLGGYIVTNINWRWIFFINVPLGIAAVLMCLAFLPPDAAGERERGGVDWIAIALLAAGVGSLQTVLEEGHAEEWFDSPFIVAFSAVAVVSLALFVHRELSSERPIVDLRVLRHRSLWAGSLLSAVIGMGLYGALFAVPIFAQTILGYTSQQTGMLLLPGALASALSMPLVARLVNRFDPRALLVAGGLILLVALFQLHQLTPVTGAGDLFWPLIIRSFGTTLMFLPLSMATLGPLPKRDIAAATGIYSLTRQLGGSVGVAVLTTVLADRQAFHRAILVSHMGASDPTTVERVAAYTSAFAAKGFDLTDARNKALHVLDGIVNLQAAVMSFNDTFWVTAVLVIATLPLVFLLGKGRGGPVSAGH